MWLVTAILAHGRQESPFCMLNTMATDILVMQGTWASAAMVLTYRQFSNIRHTHSPNLNVSRLVLQLSLPNPLKPWC